MRTGFAGKHVRSRWMQMWGRAGDGVNSDGVRTELSANTKSSFVKGLGTNEQRMNGGK